MTADRGQPPQLTPEPRPPLGVALEWVGRVLAVCVVMVLPGLIGHWLDQRWGTGFLVIVGFALGLTAGIQYLLMMTASIQRHRGGTDPKKDQRT